VFNVSTNTGYLFMLNPHDTSRGLLATAWLSCSSLTCTVNTQEKQLFSTQAKRKLRDREMSTTERIFVAVSSVVRKWLKSNSGVSQWNKHANLFHCVQLQDLTFKTTQDSDD